MNQLSKEAIEAIEEIPVPLYLGLSENYFRVGMIQALTNPEIYEKAGLIILEDAMGFAEWAQYECIRINGDWQLGKEYYTTAQLFQIYKQQKP